MITLSDSFRQMAEYFRHMAVFGLSSRDMYALSSVAEQLGEGAKLVDRGLVNGSTVTIDWSFGSNQIVILGQNAAITLQSLDPGKEHFLTIVGAFSPTFPGVHWVNGTAPTPTATAGRADIYSFLLSGTFTVGKSWGQNIAWT